MSYAEIKVLQATVAAIIEELAEVRAAIVEKGGRLPENGAPGRVSLQMRIARGEFYPPASRIEGINPGRLRR